MFMCIQNLDKLCPLVLKILSGNEIVTDLRNNGKAEKRKDRAIIRLKRKIPNWLPDMYFIPRLVVVWRDGRFNNWRFKPVNEMKEGNVTAVLVLQGHMSCIAKNLSSGFRPGPARTGLYSHRRWLEAENL